MLRDCSPTISREHYVSRSLLEQLAELGIAGAGWQPADEIKDVSAMSLTVKVLCERHNNSLSPLDAEAARLFRTLRDFDAGFRESVAAPTSEEVIINGADVERWMLKAVAAMALGGVVRTPALRSDTPWLEVLFGYRDWPAGWGLYVAPDAAQCHSFDGVEIITHVHDDAVWAASFDIGGVKLGVALGRPDPPAQRRPEGIDFLRAGGDARKRVTLTWPRGAARGYQEMTRVGQYDGPRPQDVSLRRV